MLNPIQYLNPIPVMCKYSSNIVMLLIVQELYHIDQPLTYGSQLLRLNRRGRTNEASSYEVKEGRGTLYHIVSALLAVVASYLFNADPPSSQRPYRRIYISILTLPLKRVLYHLGKIVGSEHIQLKLCYTFYIGLL